MIIAAIGGALLTGSLLGAGLANADPDGQRYKDCKATMENEGYKGDVLEQAIQFCVDYQ
jgi:hypothetical protein